MGGLVPAGSGLLADLVEEPAVAQRHRRRLGEGLEQPQVGLGEGPDRALAVGDEQVRPGQVVDLERCDDHVGVRTAVERGIAGSQVMAFGVGRDRVERAGRHRHRRDAISSGDRVAGTGRQRNDECCLPRRQEVSCPVEQHRLDLVARESVGEGSREVVDRLEL